ncbi:MAG: hypothetical protein H0W87_01465 [Actinobacteria bacterium]|nr:hypothetical protein [Actinomycetota bacterium]
MSFQPKHRGFPGKKSVTFRIPNTNNQNFDHGWGFTASIGGGLAHFVQMDTGSRGVVVPAAVLGPKAVGPGPPGQIEYTSDGKIFLGHYYLTPLKLSAGGVSVTTVPIQVLGVQQAACDPAYPKCVVGKIDGLGLIGVGFDRGTSGPAPPELTNGFLALTGIVQGSMHPGYIVRAASVTLGLTSAGQAGYSRIPLQPGGTGPGDWNTESGCFGFPQISGYASLCGTMLVDTGINSAILGLARSQRPPSIPDTIPDGVSINFAAPSTVNPVASYTFTTGSGEPPAPTSVRWAAGSAPFVNTGRNLIARFNYLFDDGSGRVGFKPATP